MNVAIMNIDGRARRVMTAQLIVAAVLAVTAIVMFDTHHGLSVVYGGLVDLVLALLLGRSVRRAEEVAATDPKRGMTVLYVGAVQRFFLLIAMFAVGLAALRLDALAVVTGFAAARVAQVISARGMTGTNVEEGLK